MKLPEIKNRYIMNIENQKMANGIAHTILPSFNGLSEKGSIKMMKSINKYAESLSKKFHKIQLNDCRNNEKNEKKVLKKVEKKIKKENISAKVAAIMGKEKPRKISKSPEIGKIIKRKAVSKKQIEIIA